MKRIITLGLLTAAWFGIAPGCSYDLPTSEGAGSTTSSSTAATSSGSAGNGGNGGSGGAGGSAGGTPNSPVVSCAKESSCTSPSVCCTNQEGSADCSIPFNCVLPGITVYCDGPEDCESKICCGAWDDMTQKYINVNCAPTCFAPARIICHPDRAETGCPGEMKCREDQSLGPTYGYCE